ncbi:MAG TPA: MmcQ/YjbR family DNA-binding protein [Candidatus Acidoferrales bacterium]|nr:MmcQ/YjbR family DNA-binding protein [Candidatus Acidoferrales bacterium]
MTATEFRRLALSFTEASESAHMNHPDFRVNNKIFATLGYPDKEWAMVRLTPEQQSEFVHDEPETFIVVKGAWGKQGATNVRLKAAKKDVTRRALEAAWSNAKAPVPAKSRKKRP